MTLLIIGSQRSDQFAAAVATHAPEIDVRVWPNAGRIEDIRYALAWGPPPGALKTVPNLELIVSVGAGVDHLFKDPELPNVPVVRYVDPDLTNRMTQYVALHVLWHQRRMCEFQQQQARQEWKYLPEPAAQDVRVGIMGLGVMGAASTKVLSAIGYQLRGWSRTAKQIPGGMKCFVGREQLPAFLAEVDILVCLLPNTPDTRGILNRDLFRGLSKAGRHPRLPGPSIINAGRGPLQIEADILAALDAGELHSASLDVFETEPLDKASPLWCHPRVVITPHNAAESETNAIVRYMLRQVRAHMAGQPVENIVDPARQY
jgi:glyoxylate/hydroxypyruvate reductase A